MVRMTARPRTCLVFASGSAVSGGPVDAQASDAVASVDGAATTAEKTDDQGGYDDGVLG